MKTDRRDARKLIMLGGASRWTAVGLLVALTGSAGCKDRVERDAHAASPPATPVSVAQPARADVNEAAEYTGRADSVDYVEIRARVTGHLQRVAFHEGELVHKGDLLFVVDPRPYEAALARAKGAFERSKVDLAFAQRDATRAKQLVDSQSISEREWDNQNSAFERITADSTVAAAELRTSELDLEYAFVRAPVNGRVGRILVTVGNLVGPTTQQPLTTLVSVDPLYVYVDVEDSRSLSLARPHAGESKPLTARVGFPGEQGYPHEASVDFMDNRIDPSTGTIKLRLVVNNSDGRLTPGLFARVQMPSDEGPHTSWLISDQAVGTDQDRKYVYVVDKDNRVQYRAVRLGSIHNQLRIVHEGLTGSDRVIVRGLQRVRPGAPVAPTTVSMGSLDAPSGEPGTAP